MILSQVREIVTRAIDEPLPRLDVIAFHDGVEIPRWMLAKMIDAATRGYITPAGEKLFLIPVKTYAQAKRDSIARIKSKPRRRDENKPSRIPWPEIRKRDCFQLKCYLSPAGATKPENQSQRPRKLRSLDTKTRYASRSPKGSDKSSVEAFVCAECDIPLTDEKLGKRFCSTRCWHDYRRGVA